MAATEILFRLNQRSLMKVMALIQHTPVFLHARMYDAFDESAKEWTATMNQRFQGNPLKSRTGSLRRSLQYKISPGRSLKTGLNKLRLRIVSRGRVYALAQEHGHPGIVPRRAKYLTIPAKDNLTPAGVRKISATQAINQGAFPIGPKGARTFLVKRVGRGKDKGSLKFLFRLTKGPVILKPRLGFYQTWHLARPKQFKRYAMAMALALRDAKGISTRGR